MADATKIDVALRASKRYLELHERGPIGKLQAHRIFREVGILRCPICELVGVGTDG